MHDISLLILRSEDLGIVSSSIVEVGEEGCTDGAAATAPGLVTQLDSTAESPKFFYVVQGCTGGLGGKFRCSAHVEHFWLAFTIDGSASQLFHSVHVDMTDTEQIKNLRLQALWKDQTTTMKQTTLSTDGVHHADGVFVIFFLVKFGIGSTWQAGDRQGFLLSLVLCFEDSVRYSIKTIQARKKEKKRKKALDHPVNSPSTLSFSSLALRSAWLHNRHPVHPAVAYNALRQHHVNRVAEHVGSGTGTARYYGMPGVDDFRYAAPSSHAAYPQRAAQGSY
ncbi:hypothetical protein CAPTEDRAFT_217383 [Capitella teleta]|uniref:Uncharacterized protein n=1 Tax=Capitella teleta TaxID=283909 RepID=R7TA81_CAPTE|nr:hypothetical protein CAPTEDRAFT_217383 [Capitella teleta]|eukprot:ELT90387.1 hypothetical protein CAPTEDRAFT_217383 [Capitella teleta]